jgi:septal ring factor EnvC (AmiA/AmiB activator)
MLHLNTKLATEAHEREDLQIANDKLQHSIEFLEAKQAEELDKAAAASEARFEEHKQMSALSAHMQEQSPEYKQ